MIILITPSNKWNKKPSEIKILVIKNGATINNNIANPKDISKVNVASFAVIFSSWFNCWFDDQIKALIPNTKM